MPKSSYFLCGGDDTSGGTDTSDTRCIVSEPESGEKQLIIGPKSDTGADSRPESLTALILILPCCITFAFFRCIGEISKKEQEYVSSILVHCGVPFFLDILNTNDEETLNASSYVVQLILDSLSNAHIIKKVKEMRKNPRMMTSDDRKWCIKVENERIELIKSKSFMHDGHLTSKSVTHS